MEGPYSARFYRFFGGLRVGRDYSHRPVLVPEVLAVFAPLSGLDPVTVVDGTLGGGGHAEALLEGLRNCSLLGIDKDPDALDASRARLRRFGARVKLVRGDFRDVAQIVRGEGRNTVEGILLDLGVSSYQLDVAARGFSYRSDAPLDMRMDPSGTDPTTTLTAADVVNGYPVEDLVRIIRDYGEERHARRIAASIVRRRPLRSTTELADVVRDAIPAAARRSGPHPARRTFQAIRIEVNDELGALNDALDGADEVLAPRGRLAVISYHSLEDRAVKRFLAEGSTPEAHPRLLPVKEQAAPQAGWRLLTRRPIRPSDEEILENPRARSARLRSGEKVA